MTTPKEELLAQFDECPVCKGKNFLMDKLVKEAIAAGKTTEDTEPCLLLISAVAVSQKHTPIIGSFVPTGVVITDSCLDCGAIFSRKIIKSESVVMPTRQGMQRPGVM